MCCVSVVAHYGHGKTLTDADTPGSEIEELGMCAQMSEAVCSLPLCMCVSCAFIISVSILNVQF